MRLQEAIILAGGLGTRLRSMVEEQPKSMAPINGRPFLEYLLDHLIAQGIIAVFSPSVIKQHTSLIILVIAIATAQLYMLMRRSHSERAEPSKTPYPSPAVKRF